MGFKRFDPEDFLVSADAVSSTVWSGNSPELIEFYTSSAQFQTAGDYYLSIYQTASSNPSAEVQFDVAYGHKYGSGSLLYNTSVTPPKSPASTIYGQYRTLVLEDENSDFTFGNIAQDYFYAINVSRARYKEKLLPGSLNLTLRSASVILSLTDNSQDVALPTFYGTQRAYQVVSGSNGSAYNISTGGTGYTANSGSYGLFLPDISTILLNGKALDLSGANGGISLGTNVTYNADGQNVLKLYQALVSGSSFELNSEETITSDFVFVRSRNAEFNYSENPSFISGSTGEVIYPYFINNPQVYPTTVGLYNDASLVYDLIAENPTITDINMDLTGLTLVYTPKQVVKYEAKQNAKKLNKLVTIKSEQSLFDLSLQHYGDVSFVYQLIKENTYLDSILSESYSSNILTLNAEKNYVNNYYAKAGIEIGTKPKVIVIDGVSVNYLLQENGGYLLQENGDKIIL